MAAPNMEIFDQYFVKADSDRDGRISGAEAVSFFQGSNVPKQFLAQIWMHADQNKTGFLGRPEFYNALKLVTVAQSGRTLTPDIVKAALFGPASAKIPAPKIDSAPVPATQSNTIVTPSPPTLNQTSPTSQMGHSPQMGSASLIRSAPQGGQVRQMVPTPQMGVTSQMGPTSQNLGLRGPHVSMNMGLNQATSSALNNSLMRPHQSTIHASSLTPNQEISQNQSFQGMNKPYLSSDWNIRSNEASAPEIAPNPQTSIIKQANNSKTSVPFGNGFHSDSMFGGDMYSASQEKPGALISTFSSTSMTSSSSIAPVVAGSQNTAKSSQPESFQNILALAPGGAQIAQSHSLTKQNQVDATHNTKSTSNVSVGGVSSSMSQTHPQWPKVTQNDIRKYTKVFVEVDKDRDGKISGEQARNLFLSWKLPREVLKQVWDLSDQDNDSMLTLCEFCIALYLMERYKEGRPLPHDLPNSLRFDEILLRATGQPSTAYAAPSWQMTPGIPHQGNHGQHPGLPTSGPRPPLNNNFVGSMQDGVFQPSQHMLQAPDKNMHNLQNRVEQETHAGGNESTVQEMKKILDSREKIEFYRTKMQELVLYKSRCENRLNEISERASASKREVESLTKKYEERYKQVAEIASRLTVEEATFRHVQERKVELHNALVKMEQGGSVDGLLQVRADRIQSDLDELAKALSQRSKHRGIDLKTTASVELPFGWQLGIQESAVDWDEEWDRFEDEGFAIAKELYDKLDEGSNHTKDSPKVWGDELFEDDHSTIESPSHHYDNASEHGDDNGSAELSESESHGTPRRTTFDSPRDIHSSFNDDVSPHANDNFSRDHGGAESTITGDKFGDESLWGANFDTNDDADSVWGFNTKDSGNNSFFGSGDFGLDPINVDSSNASSEFGKDKKASFFADSIPNSPLFSSSSPQSFNDKFDNHSFDTSSRLDSFSMHDSGLFNKQPETLSRFDSMKSTSEYNHNQGFSFDDGDPFGSTGPFKSTSDNHSPRKGSDNWNAF